MQAGDFTSKIYIYIYIYIYISACDSDPTELVTPKINKHTTYSCSIFTHSSLDSNKNKHDFSGGQDSVKAFCANLKNYTTKQYQKTQQK